MDYPSDVAEEESSSLPSGLLKTFIDASKLICLILRPCLLNFGFLSATCIRCSGCSFTFSFLISNHNFPTVTLGDWNRPELYCLSCLVFQKASPKTIQKHYVLSVDSKESNSNEAQYPFPKVSTRMVEQSIADVVES